MKLAALLSATALATLIGGAASAQDPSLQSANGEVNLRAGFTPDPYTINVVAGGPEDASRLGGQCVGNIGRAPDFRINYTPGDYALTIRVQSQIDTTLIVNNPDGGWYCNDDLGSSPNPGVVYRHPQSGTYDIWVGSFSDTPASARITVTETE